MVLRKPETISICERVLNWELDDLKTIKITSFEQSSRTQNSALDKIASKISTIISIIRRKLHGLL